MLSTLLLAAALLLGAPAQAATLTRAATLTDVARLTQSAAFNHAAKLTGVVRLTQSAAFTQAARLARTTALARGAGLTRAAKPAQGRTASAAQATGSTGDALVSPNPVRAGQQIEVVATCAAGVTSAVISAAALDGASDIPMLASHVSSTEWVAILTIPIETRPGTYDLSGRCSDGARFRARVVVGTRTGPMGGDGSTLDGANPLLLSLGTGMLSLALIGGALLMRSRPTP